MKSFSFSYKRLLVISIVVNGALLLAYSKFYSGNPSRSIIVDTSRVSKPSDSFNPVVKSSGTNKDVQNSISPAITNADSAAVEGRKKSIYLLKTHKTGSSAIQNLILRQAMLSNLTVGLSSDGADWSRLCINRKFSKNCVCNRDEMPLNILTHHMLFNKDELKASLKQDAVFVSIVRDPVKIITSGYTYFEWDKRLKYKSFDDFVKAKETSTEMSSIGLPYRNILMYICGLKPVDFDNKKKIQEKLEELESTFDLVMVHGGDYFKQSLILLKHAMGWTTKDVVIIAVNQQAVSQPKPKVTPELEEILKRANHADRLMYEWFLEKFKAKVAAFGTDKMEKEVQDLIRTTDEMQKFCIAGTKPGVWGTLAYVLTPEGRTTPYCRYLATTELDFTKLFIGRYNDKGNGKKCPGPRR